MNNELVALDLETTGLDAGKDQIIEIGAVRFSNDQIIDRWGTLVKPDISIPREITDLTGISNGDVSSAPSIYSVAPELEKFVGALPVVGHNVRFDLSFLANVDLKFDSPIIDTYAVASTLLPSAPRYSLSALASLLSIQQEGAHRALDDANTTALVYIDLWSKVSGVPVDILAEIVRAGNLAPWDGAPFFEAALRNRSGKVADKLTVFRYGQFSEKSATPKNILHQGQSRERLESLDGVKISKLVDSNGTLSKNLVEYEHRPQQVMMTSFVAQAFTEGQQILVEAPTGVGKSIAYLLPAASFASETGERVIISTNTITLQDQLINKDVPLVRKTLGLDFSAVVLKGRANYLCPRRLEALRNRGPNSSEETQMLARILVWLSSGNGTGDRGDITIRGPIEAAIWSKLSAEDEGCKLERCSSQMEGMCPFYQARTFAEKANLVIVNHSLLLADAATEGRVLPEYDHLIVDEAHHLEEATTNGLSFQTDQNAIGRHLVDLGSGNKGILGEMLRRTHEAIPPGYFETLSEFVAVVVQASSYMSQHIEWFFLSLRTFLERAGKVSRDEYSSQTRIVDALRRQPGWANVQSSWENLSQFTSSIAEAMVRLEGGLRDLSDYDIEDYDDLMSSVGAAARHFSEFHNRLNQLVNKPDSNTIYWIEYLSYNDKLTVHAAPLDVGPLLQRHLWNSKRTIVMTSATLRTQGSFDYIRQQLDADHMTEQVIGSPFDYKNSTLLYLVNDIPEPTDQDGYQRAMESGLISLCESTNGRTLVLFTSYAQLRRTASVISAPLAQSGIIVYDQAGGNSRTQLIDGFVRTDKAVLMGTRTFWEGVDVPGSDLSVVVITRLPFSVPHDPIFAARSEQYQDAFNQFAIPETILKFRQGFGRLIRRKSDLGVAVILDRRILTKRYGRLFIEALPECTSKVGPLSDLAPSAANWLGQS